MISFFLIKRKGRMFIKNKSSLTRLNQDECTYKQNLKQSMGPGEYMVNVPHTRCDECFEPDPSFRMSSQVRQPNGVSRCANTHFIDVDSELKGITRPATNCAQDQFLGQKYCNLKHMPDCNRDHRRPTEDTRLSNPPCTLRGTGWNRWEWLCMNPQDKALVPFEYNINNRLLVKDNHRPCVTDPIEDKVSPPLTAANEADFYGYVPKKEPIADYPTGQAWRNCSIYKGYGITKDFNL